MRQQLFDALDDVEATTKRLVGDASRAAMDGQNAIIDGMNVQRHIVGTIPGPTAEMAADEAATKEPDRA